MLTLSNAVVRIRMPETRNTRKLPRVRQPRKATATSPTSLLPATDGFIIEMQPISINNGSLPNDDLELPMDFVSIEIAGPEEEEMEFNYASAWPDGIFLTSV